jgi:NADPH-dependent curcumin reductase CurA
MIKGFLVLDYYPRIAEFYAEMGPWFKEGAVKSRETILEGLENVPNAFLGLFKGENFGKMLVKL